MTFGVLEAITGQKIPESLLLSHRDDGTLVLTSKNVSRLISYWLFGLPPVRHHKRVMQWADETGKILAWASGAINEEMMSSKTEVLSSAAGLTRNEFNDMLCSLSFFYNWLFQPLLQYVRCASTIITSSSVPRFYDAPHAAIFAIVDGLTRRMGLMVTNYNPFTNIFKERLIAGGWCPSAPAILQSNLFALGLATTLVPFHRHSPPEHKKCSAERCFAHNLDPDKYVTQHAPGCSDPEGCPFLSPPLARVSDVLSSGQCPIVVYDGHELTVRSPEDGPFVAISHVWADGLGSTTEAGLPRCQVARISALVRQLVPDGAFWVDSLCIPHAKLLRKAAIRMMAETYQRAAQVIVLDAGIRTLCTSTGPLKETVLRIVTSLWMQRIWTLQEALLANELYFEFADGLYPVTRLGERRRAALEPTESTLGIIPKDPFTALSIPQSLTLILDRRLGLRRTFDQMVSLLAHRTTSKPEDETVSIAGLFGVNVDVLLAEDGPDARMRALLLELKTIPANIIVNLAEKLPYDGFRWAPRTLTTVGTSSALGLAQCTPQGLTTDDNLVLIEFSAAVRGTDGASPDGYPDAITIENVENDMVYYVGYDPTRSGQHCSPADWHGLIAFPQNLRSVAKESVATMDAVAVRIMRKDSSALTCDAESEKKGDQQTVVCRYLFPVTLMQWPSGKREQFRKRKEEVESGRAQCPFLMLEGRFSEVRVTLT